MRPLHLFYFISVFFILVSVNLFRIQIVDYSYYKEQSERNRMRPVILEAPRGVVLDRYGRELVSNRLAFDCFIVPQEGKEYLEKTLHRLSLILADSEPDLMKNYESGRTGLFTPVLLSEDVRKDAAIRIEEESDFLPGVFIKTRPVRQYNIGKAGAHVLGYVGPVSSSEYRDLKDYGYRMIDLVGKTGIERSYESYLKGKNGAVQYETDSRGRLLRVLSIQEPVDGRILQVALDMDLQLFVNDLLADYTGAVCVMDLESGGILAMASAPSFDPGLFSRPRNRDVLRDIFADPRHPLINRAIAAQVPPGSTFKIVTAHAALSAGKLTRNTEFFCPGYFMVGKHRFNCWRRGGHGAQNIVEGLEHSCNVFFYNVGSRLDVSTLGAMAKEFGLGRKTMIDLPGEKDGLVPSREWKRKVFRQSWYKGETVILAIGQGYLLVTPLQMLRAASVAATDGFLYQPHLVTKIGDVEVEARRARRVISSGHLATVRKGLRLVVQSPTGTGQRAKSKAVEVFGKTGTAQAPSGADHAWFVGFAPYEGPEAAVLVFLEHGGKGGVSAAKMAGATFTWMAENGYFR